MRFIAAFMTLCALGACGEGRHASWATLVLSYNGLEPFPAVIGEPMALMPAVFWTVGHYTVNPPLPPGLSLDELSGVISGTPTQARGRAIFVVNAPWRRSARLVSVGAERDGAPEPSLLTPARPQVLWECPSGHGFQQSQAPSNTMR
jgi:hypothetical protein